MFTWRMNLHRWSREEWTSTRRLNLHRCSREKWTSTDVHVKNEPPQMFTWRMNLHHKGWTNTDSPRRMNPKSSPTTNVHLNNEQLMFPWRMNINRCFHEEWTSTDVLMKNEHQKLITKHEPHMKNEPPQTFPKTECPLKSTWSKIIHWWPELP